MFFFDICKKNNLSRAILFGIGKNDCHFVSHKTHGTIFVGLKVYETITTIYSMYLAWPHGTSSGIYANILAQP